MMNDRGQLYTLEGIAAGLVILMGLLFALQATTATPGATGSMNPHAEQQDRVTAQGMLDTMNDSTLRQAVLYWDPSADESGTFHCSPGGAAHYPGFATDTTCDPSKITTYPPNTFGQNADLQLGTAYNINVLVTYHESGNSFGEQRMVFQGQPGTGAVRASTSVVLTNNQSLYEKSDNIDNPTGKTLAEVKSNSSSNFYAPPSDGKADDDDIYNVLYIEVVVWR